MSAPKGNKNAVGNSGGKKGRSGRKSKFVENANADLLWDMFTREYTNTELREMAKGRKSVHTTMLLKAIGGNERLIIAIFKKVFPDSMRIEGNYKNKSLEELNQNIKNILENIPKRNRRK